MIFQWTQGAAKNRLLSRWAVKKKRQASHHRDDGGGHVRELDAALMQGSHQQLPVLASVLMLHVVCLHHFLLQHQYHLCAAQARTHTYYVQFTPSEHSIHLSTHD